MVSNFLNLFAISIFVPIPSVLATIIGSLNLNCLKSNTEAKLPILLLLSLFNFFKY